jgi:hypothetical protein
VKTPAKWGRIAAKRFLETVGGRRPGAEYLALAGATRIVSRYRPIITSDFSLEMLRRVSRIEGADYLRWIRRLVRISIVKTDRSALDPVSDGGGLHRRLGQRRTHRRPGVHPLSMIGLVRELTRASLFGRRGLAVAHEVFEREGFHNAQCEAITQPPAPVAKAWS